MQSYYENYAVLKIWMDTEKLSPEIVAQITEYVAAHNEATNSDPNPNSGFDLIVPADFSFTTPGEGKLLNHGIKCAMYYMDDDISCAYYLYPRSSIYKTPLMLANSVGIIDSGYRGWICSALKCFSCSVENPYVVNGGTRITQLCHPSLCPILVEIVSSEEELGQTSRGDGGFGSTGGVVPPKPPI